MCQYTNYRVILDLSISFNRKVVDHILKRTVNLEYLYKQLTVQF